MHPKTAPRLRLAAALLVASCVPAVALAGPLAPLPGPQALAAPPSVAEQLSRGVVTVEQGGHIVAVGAVLGGEHGDGRILTALSPLGTSETADVRYADGSVVHAKVGHRDRAWDLALLVPQTGHWLDGLIASSVNPVGAPLQTPVALRAGRPALLPGRVRGVIEARAKEGGGALSSVLDIELQGGTPSLGAPIVDGTGGVVGVFIRACQTTLPMVPAADAAHPQAAPPPPPCVPLVVAAPLSSIIEFLSHTPATAVTPTPWLGIVGVSDTESNTRGVRVMAVAPDSPAQKAGLKANEDRAQADMIVAVDSQPVDTPEKLAEIISHHAIGERVKLLLLTGGKFHESAVVLKTAP